MNSIQIFNSIRDVLYKIALNPDEKDRSCYGKHKRLFKLLKNEDYNVRYRICTFSWQDVSLPVKLKKMTSNDQTSTLYLEVFLDDDWIVLDASWDRGLKDIFQINEWDGKSDTQIAVKPTETYSPWKSQKIVDEIEKKFAGAKPEELFPKKDSDDYKFCKVFNKWLEENRIQK